MEEKDKSTRFPINRNVRKREAKTSSEEESKLDRLFESEWEVLVVQLDRATGEFHTRTDREASIPG
jgi:hypothetical protein